MSWQHAVFALLALLVPGGIPAAIALSSFALCVRVVRHARIALED